MEQEAIEQFFTQRSFAVVGVSRSGTGFGNMVFKELTEKGHIAFQVNPSATEINGHPCYPSLADLPEKVEAVVVTVAPEHALGVVREADAAGVRHVWLQQGAESEDAVAFGERTGMHLVSGRCFFMFFEPVESIHAFHRFLAKLFGRYPRPARA